MRILITGGSGFTGKYVIDALGRNNEILVVGRNQHIQFIRINNYKELPYYQTDYSVDSLETIFSIFKPTAVVHLAAQRPLHKNVTINNYIDNLTNSIAIFETCLKFEIINIVFASSKSVYSKQNPLPWSESMLPIAFNNYGLSKLWIEDAASFYNSKGLRIKTLRLAQVIGLGEREGFVLQTYLSNAIARKPLNVYGNNVGKRQYIYVKDMVQAVKKAIYNAALYGVFNIGMRDGFSFLQLANTINKVFENPAGIIHSKNKEADENIYLMDVSKAQKELHWQPNYCLEEAYEDIKHEIEKQGNL